MAVFSHLEEKIVGEHFGWKIWKILRYQTLLLEFRLQPSR